MKIRSNLPYRRAEATPHLVRPSESYQGLQGVKGEPAAQQPSLEDGSCHDYMCAPTAGQDQDDGNFCHTGRMHPRRCLTMYAGVTIQG